MVAGGVNTPTAKWLRLFSFLIPATYYLEILRGIIIRGAGIAALWDEAAALAGFGIFFMTLSALRFEKHLG